MKLHVALLALGLACSALATPAVDPTISKSLSEKDSVDIIVTFKNDQTAKIRSQFKSMSFPTRSNRIQSFYNTLKSHADGTQQAVLRMLRQHRSAQPIDVHQLWLTNKIIIKKADSSLIEKLASMPEIAEITQDRIIPMLKPIEAKQTIPQEGEQWGVAKIEAPSVWGRGNRGNGSVIGTIDTGVRGTHEALRDNRRAINSWFDPGARTSIPTDTNGHGTHTMGTICGRTNGIGVAPDAQWIACRGCGEGGGCSTADLEACAQWMVCPTDVSGNNPRCDLAPNAVSNSWGGGQDDKWYDPYIESWITVGIGAFFSNGNSGPSCASANSPADSLKEPIAVGSTTEADDISYFSSVGPTIRFRRIKPDISAPGSDVYSAVQTSDTSYGFKSGTSMACPHAAGLAALLYSVNPNLSHAQVRELLVAGAQNTKSTGGNCGGISDSTFPNHHAGQGRISARASLDELTKMMKQ
jgi:hypothetical protein